MGADAEKYAQWIVDNKDKKGTPEFETVAKAYKLAKAEKPGAIESALEDSGVKDFVAGQFESLQNLGANTVGRLTDALGIKYHGMPISEYNKQQREKLYSEQKVNPKNSAFQLGKVAGDVELTMPLSYGLGGAASKVPQLNKYAQLLRTGGMDLGKAATGSKLANALIRGATGAGEGYLTGQLVNPEEAGTASMVQGAISAGSPLISELFNRGANKLMMSAIKPAKSELESGAGQKAVNTMLEEGVNPTLHRTIFGRGLDTLENKIGELNNQISTIIQNSKGTISKSQVIGYLDDLLNKAKHSLDWKSDTAAVQAVKDQLLEHPLATGENIPVQLAQKLKQGTYKSIGTKNFNEIGGYTKEALRAGAKGLKEGIANVENVGALNAKESDLINALDVAESRAYQALKNNPAGIAGLAENPMQFAAMMADRSDAFKALIARMLYQTGKGFSGVSKVPMGTTPAALASQGEQ